MFVHQPAPLLFAFMLPDHNPNPKRYTLWWKVVP